MTDSNLEVQVMPDRDLELSGLEDGAQAAIDHARRMGWGYRLPVSNASAG